MERSKRVHRSMAVRVDSASFVERINSGLDGMKNYLIFHEACKHCLGYFMVFFRGEEILLILLIMEYAFIGVLETLPPIALN